MRSNNTIKPTVKFALAGVAVGATTLLVGCGGPGVHGFMANPTPELRTHTERPIDTRTTMASTRDANWRSFHEDLGRAFFTDRPSRLTLTPIVP